MTCRHFLWIFCSDELSSLLDLRLGGKEPCAQALIPQSLEFHEQRTLGVTATCSLTVEGLCETFHPDWHAAGFCSCWMASLPNKTSQKCGRWSVFFYLVMGLMSQHDLGRHCWDRQRLSYEVLLKEWAISSSEMTVWHWESYSNCIFLYLNCFCGLPVGNSSLRKACSAEQAASRSHSFEFIEKWKFPERG